MTVHSDNKTTKETAQQLCMRQCCARLVCLSVYIIFWETSFQREEDEGQQS